MAADLHVMRAARRSGALKLRPNLPVVCRCLVGERQHVQPRHEMLDRLQVLDTAGRLLGAVMQLSERDARYAKVLGQRVEFFPKL